MKMGNLIVFSFVILSVLLSNVFSMEDAELQLVQLVWRHGDRAPIELYPTDPNSEEFWKEGLGKLTMLGKRQHYALGKLLRKMYTNFTTTSPLEVDILSADCDRCIKSAEANLASFYAPSKNWKFEDDVNWQPLSVHYIPKDEDKYLETDSYCPEAIKEENRIMHSKEGQAVIAENWEMFEYLTNHSGSSVTNWTSANYLFDTLNIEKKYKLITPSWANTYWDQLHNVSTLSFYWSFNSPLMLRLRAGPLLGKVVENMKMKISGERPDVKVQIYSTHDTVVALLLQALNVYNMKAPPYCSTVIIELYRTTLDYHVRLLYLNSSNPELVDQVPNVLILDGCTEYCPLGYFVNRTKPFIPVDWESECKLKSRFFDINSETNCNFNGLHVWSTYCIKENFKFHEAKLCMTAAVIFTLLALFIIGISSFAFWRLHSRTKTEYSYHLMQSDIN